MSTVAELIERAIDVTDEVDQHITEARWLRFASRGNEMLTALLPKLGYVWAESTSVQTTVAGTSAYAIPDAVCVLAVHITLNGQLVPLEPADPLLDRAGTERGTPCTWRMTQGAGSLNVSVFPPPDRALTLTVTYIAQPAPLTSTAATVNYPAGFDEWIVLHMARRALTRQGVSNRAINALQAEVEQFIRDQAWDRTVAAHQRVRNVDRPRDRLLRVRPSY